MPNDSTIAPYALPAYPLQRVRYYNGQFLKAGEFIADQQYHIDRKQRHDRLLHVAGVAEGLTVAVGAGGATVTVAPGTAVDDQGRRILLPPAAGSTSVAQTFTVDSTWGPSMVLEIVLSEMDDVLADQNSAVSDYTRFTQSSVVVARDPSVNPTPTPDSVYLALVTTNAPATPRIATGVSTAGRVYSGVSLPGPAGATGPGTGALRSQGDAYPGWAQLGCSLNVAASGSFGAPALPPGGYTLGTGDVAATGKVLAGNLGALPATPPTLYVGGAASITGASTFGAPALPTATGSYTLHAGDLASSGSTLLGNLSALPASPPTLYVGGSAAVTGNIILGTPSLPGSFTPVSGDLAAAGKAFVAGALTVGSSTSAHTVSGSVALGAPSLLSGFAPLVNGDLALAGRAYVAGALTAGASTSAHTVSGSVALGAPSLPGGFAPLGSGDLAVAGRAYVAGALTAGASTSAHTVSGSLALGAPSLPSGFAPLVNGDLAVAGRGYVAGALTVGGASSLGGNLFANGNDIYLGAGSSTTSGLVYNGQFDGPFAFGSTGGALGGSKSGTRFVKTSTQYVQLPTMPLNSGATGGPNFAGGFSCAAWVYLYGIDPWVRIVDLGAGQQNDNIVFGILATGALAFEVFQGTTGGNTVATPAGALTLNQWIHVAVTMDASGNVMLYKNGVALATGATSVPRNVARGSNYIAKSNWTGDFYLNAIVSQVSLWSAVHAPTNLSGSLAGNETGLVGYYKLTDVSGASAPDSSAGTQPNRIGNATVVNGAALSSAPTTALVWDGTEQVTVGYGGGNLTVQGSATVGTWTSTSSTSPVPPPTALSVYGTLSFPGLSTTNPPATITQRWIPAGQYPSVGGVPDTTNTNERSELILYNGNDPPNGAGPDLITLRAPAIRLQTYNNTSVGDITNAAGSNDRLYIDVNGNVGLGTVAPAYPLDVVGMARVGTGSSSLLLSSSYQGVANATRAEISNDTTTYKTLMLLGNLSADGINRSVSVWDKLNVYGSLTLANGPQQPGSLTMAGSASVGGTLSVTQGGTVGGTLSVSGDTTIGTSSSAILLSSSYQGANSIRSTICNDSSNYKTLMLVGNTSGDGTNRSVSVWDKLNVYGTLTLGTGPSLPGNLTMSGNASVGGTLSVTGNATIGTSSSNSHTVHGNVNIPSDDLSFGASLRQMINLWNTDYGIGIQASTLYFRGWSYAWYTGGTHNDGQLNAGGGTTSMTLDPYGSLSVTGNATLGSSASNAHTLKGNVSVTGNLGIGTATPQQKLEVYGNLAVSSAAGNADLCMNSTTRPTIYPSGPNVPASLPMQVRSAGTAVLSLNADNAGPVSLAAGGGYVGVNTLSPVTPFHIHQSGPLALRIDDPTNANCYFQIHYEQGNDTVTFYHQSGAGQYMRQDGGWNQNSDASLKENVAPLGGMLDKVMRLRPVSFDWKSNGMSSIGFIAQEVEPVLPELVSEHSHQGTTLKGLPYASFSVAAIAAIQDMKREYDARIQALEERIAALSARASGGPES